MPEKGERPPIRSAPDTSLAEWIAAAVSAVLVLGVIGFLIYEGVLSSQTPPDVTIEVDSILPAGPGHLVILEAQNTGRSTAADLVVQGELMADSGRVEISETTIDYVPGGGKQRAGLFFTRDPRGLKLRLRALGYRDP